MLNTQTGKKGVAISREVGLRLVKARQIFDPHMPQHKAAELLGISESVAALGPAIQAIDDAFMRFWQQNQEFENMAGGSAVLGRIDLAQCVARSATLQAVRAKALPIHALATLPQKQTLRVWTNPALPQPVLPITESKPRTTRSRNNLTNRNANGNQPKPTQNAGSR
ncbi:hypothetical protein [Methylomonas albis]|uniref:Uncharacterized protein n=1 Tax=Methylomonas albis TaxID=1854563 RepID=A0ABR9D130_9GAMM|nr:hypothetical protein [Methylomonas albis]MBD9356803.1 hypothetical protein [Methylomonas albis]